MGGQKTGFFLDQRDNRLMLQRLCAGKDVLDCFSYSCGYAAHALKGGARRAVNIDVSSKAFGSGRRNLELNCPQGSSYQMIRANVFGYLEMLAERGPSFDVVVLDPPSLLPKARSAQENHGYLHQTESQRVADLTRRWVAGVLLLFDSRYP